MKLLRFSNADKSIDVVYKTDLITNTQTNFTVLSIEGLDSTEVNFGLQFKQLPTSLDIFKKFAIDNELQLTALDAGFSSAQPIILVELPEEEEEEDPEV